MKINHTFNFSEKDRRVIADQFGDDGPASREDMLAWIEMTISGTLDHLYSENEKWRKFWNKAEGAK